MNEEVLIHSDDGEGGVCVQKYEKLHLDILALLPKVLLQENPTINDMVAIISIQFKTLPDPTTYILYHSGTIKSIVVLSKVSTSCVSAPVLVILNQYTEMDTDTPQEVLEVIKKNANSVPHYLKVQDPVRAKCQNKPHLPRDNPVLVQEKRKNVPDTPPDNTLVNMEDFTLPPFPIEDNTKLCALQSSPDNTRALHAN